MAPHPDTMDLSLLLQEEEAAKEVSSRAREWSSQISEYCPDADCITVRLLVGEFAKNALHGEAAVVHMLPLPDGSILLISLDEQGRDLISPELNGHVGTAIIKTLAGDESYQLLLQKGQYRGYLRIDPHNLTAI